MNKQRAIFRLAFIAVVAAVLLQTPKTYADVCRGPSPWAEDSVCNAISLGLVPHSLMDCYTQTATHADFCALAVAFYEEMTGDAAPGDKAYTGAGDVGAEKAAGAGSLADAADGEHYAPDELINREQAAVMLARFADAVGLPLQAQEAAYTDMGDISDWARKSVGKMQAAGIMNGMGNGMFSPADHYTVEQGIVTLLTLRNLYELYVSEAEANGARAPGGNEPPIELPEQATPLAAAPGQLEDPVFQQYAVEVLEIVNRERGEAGLEALYAAEDLDGAAAVRARELETLFAHVRPDGNLCFTVFKEFAIVSKARNENIAGNFRTPESVVKALMNSQPHREAILGSAYDRLGVGIHEDAAGKFYWVQLFAG